ncbi:Nucleotide-binding universal stress protein, UspA family [Arenibacter nanhaiticus]|uniref:Nucleotide-binding universal stress protein, UspA family n=1 Tax=Arenibacter nanhaiticus TaxID=558155 RepID=A0A1M6DX89_9FLAO|nr:universal stress protein [Arenibacter nanhaiticus]SHI77739.1 Nucleotide-binding universal stress protein, UspA family [Arenibacter nanhaiticus]
MKTILIPTDFSPNAWNAISFAMDFFKEEECLFYFLHTYTPSFFRTDFMIGGSGYSGIPNVGTDISHAGLQKTLADVRHQYPNTKHRYKMISAFNVLTDEINRLVKKKKVDMVVMGTKGATGARQLFLGSNTVFVLRKVKVPLLMVPESFENKPIQKILFSTDYLLPFKKDDLMVMINVAKMFQAEITVLHIKEEYELTAAQQNNKAFLDSCLQGIPHQIKEEKGKYMPLAILEYISEHGFQLLVMMNRKHSLFEHLLLKQNIDQIGFHVKIPFLVIPDTLMKKKKTT